MSKRNIVFHIPAAVLLLLVSVLLRVSLTQPYDLTLPVTVEDARKFASDGAVEITMRGANGSTLTIVRRGPLDAESLRQPMYFCGSLLGLVSLRRTVEKNGLEARWTQALLESWVNGKLTAQQQAGILKNDPVALKNMPSDVAVVFEVARWMAGGRLSN